MDGDTCDERVTNYFLDTNHPCTRNDENSGEHGVLSSTLRHGTVSRPPSKTQRPKVSLSPFSGSPSYASRILIRMSQNWVYLEVTQRARQERRALATHAATCGDRRWQRKARDVDSGAWERARGNVVGSRFDQTDARCYCSHETMIAPRAGVQTPEHMRRLVLNSPNFYWNDLCRHNSYVLYSPLPPRPLHR